jgi:hypothetical protein
MWKARGGRVLLAWCAQDYLLGHLQEHSHLNMFDFVDKHPFFHQRTSPTTVIHEHHQLVSKIQEN